MKAVVKDISKTEVEITVTVPNAEFKLFLDKQYEKIAQSANIPGFRKGKVPPKIIDNYYDKISIIQQTIQDGLHGWLVQAVEENDIHIIHPGETTVKELPDKKQDLIIIATMEIIPKFELPDLKDVEIKIPPVEVSQEEIDAKIDRLREQFGIMKPKDGKIEVGDFAVIDIVAKDESGKNILEQSKGTSYKVGTDGMLPGLNEALIGLGAGESKTFTSKLVGGKNVGKTAQLTVSVEKVKTQELPGVDVNFVQMASEFDTVEELKENAKKEVEQLKLIEAEGIAKEKLMDYLVDTTALPVPDKYLTARVEQQMSAIKGTREGEEGEVGIKKIEEQMREGQSRNIQEMFVAEELIRTYKVKTSNSMVLEYFQHLGMQYGVDPKTLIQQASQSGSLNEIVAGVTGNRALSVAVRKVKVVGEDGKAITFPPLPADDDDVLQAKTAETGETPETKPEAETATTESSKSSGTSGDDATQEESDTKS
jgi:trigger factor